MSQGFQELLKQSEKPFEVCIKFFLFWIAASDGQIDESEYAVIFGAFESKNQREEYETIKATINNQDPLILSAVCLTIRQGLTPEGKIALLSLATMVAIADKKLAISENFILRFLADMLAVSPNAYRKIYSDIAGSELPNPGDPSSISWWERNTKSRDDSTESDRRKYSNKSSKMSREEAFIVLGLSRNASPDDVKKAYRRMAQNHHPDRFSDLGPEAVKTAENMFVRVGEAYEVLK